MLLFSYRVFFVAKDVQAVMSCHVTEIHLPRSPSAGIKGTRYHTQLVCIILR